MKKCIIITTCAICVSWISNSILMPLPLTSLCLGDPACSLKIEIRCEQVPPHVVRVWGHHKIVSQRVLCRQRLSLSLQRQCPCSSDGKEAAEMSKEQNNNNVVYCHLGEIFNYEYDYFIEKYKAFSLHHSFIQFYLINLLYIILL